MALKENQMFSSRDTLEEALAYANELILARVPQGQARIAALTAVHVISNTVVKLMDLPVPFPSKEYLASMDGRQLSTLDREEARKLLRVMIPRIAATAFIHRDCCPELSSELGAVANLAASVLNLNREDLVEETREFVEGDFS